MLLNNYFLKKDKKIEKENEMINRTVNEENNKGNDQSVNDDKKYLYISSLLSFASLNERYFNFRFSKFFLDYILTITFDDMFKIASSEKNKDIEYFNKIYTKYKENIDINKIQASFQKNNITYLTYNNNKYPSPLKELKEPPSVIYLKGNKKLKEMILNKKLKYDNNIAIVGTRTPSSYGHFKAREMAYNLAKNYYIIISGLAKGVDLDAHIGSLRGGRTISVLAGGVNIVYPKEHQEVYNDICAKGLIISERLPDHKPNQFDFLFRNRIIAALAKYTIIIEASSKSGTKSQANYVKSLKKELIILKPDDVKRKTAEFNIELINEKFGVFETYEDLIELIKK